MSLSIASINSGSNGNCYYVGNEQEAVLIDAGISSRETHKRMRRMGLDIRKVKGIFITHEHHDHIRGLEGLASKLLIPIYITEATFKNSHCLPPPHLINYISAYQPIVLGNMTITAFPKLHDAKDAHSFIVESQQLTVGVMTDIGAPCEHVQQNFSKCHAVFLEANYDDTMLMNGRYSEHLKKRVRSDVGHLSNDQALALFQQFKSEHLKCVYLSHLSADNNKPEVALNTFVPHAGNTTIKIAPRHQESDITTLQHNQPLQQKSVPLTLF